MVLQHLINLVIGIIHKEIPVKYCLYQLSEEKKNNHNKNKQAKFQKDLKVFFFYFFFFWRLQLTFWVPRLVYMWFTSQQWNLYMVVWSAIFVLWCSISSMALAVMAKTNWRTTILKNEDHTGQDSPKYTKKMEVYRWDTFEQILFSSRAELWLTTAIKTTTKNDNNNNNDSNTNCYNR